MFGLIYLFVIGTACAISYWITDTGEHYNIPTVSELKAQQEADSYFEAGMEEVNLFLAPYTTTDEESCCGKRPCQCVSD